VVRYYMKRHAGAADAANFRAEAATAVAAVA
jgi:hypothetical protein